MNRPPYFEQATHQAAPRAPRLREPAGLYGLAILLIRHAPLILGAILLSLSIGATYFALAPTMYRAQAQLLLDPKLPEIFREASDLGLNVDTGQIETHMVVLKSRTIAMAVVNKLGLMNDPDFQKPKARFSFQSLIGRSSTAKPDPLETATDAFLENLRVDREGISQVINVSYYARSREKAALLANETTRAYIQYLINVRAETARSASEWLDERLQQLRLEMNAAAKRAQNFRASNESASLEELQLSAETYRKVYQDFYSAFTEAVQRESYPVSTIRVISEATPPPGSFSPNILLVIPSSCLIGLAVGTLLAILRESRAPGRMA